jgi:hypothetical protein
VPIIVFFKAFEHVFEVVLGHKNAIELAQDTLCQ